MSAVFGPTVRKGEQVLAPAAVAASPPRVPFMALDRQHRAVADGLSVPSAFERDPEEDS